MEVVINIPKSWGKCNNTFLRNCIRNGKVLPKGHGDLKDIGNIRLFKFARIENISLNPKFSEEFKKGYNAAVDEDSYALMSAPVLVEADKEGNDGDCNQDS